MNVCDALDRCSAEIFTEVEQHVIVMIVTLNKKVSMVNEKCHMNFESIHHMNLVILLHFDGTSRWGRSGGSVCPGTLCALVHCVLWYIVCCGTLFAMVHCLFGAHCVLCFRM